MDLDLCVVGAGSAGAVIAARATEDPSLRVLLLEAGPDYPDPALLPDDLSDGHRNSVEAHDWGFTYVPAPEQGASAMPRGKVTGGSSAVNTAIALRGDPGDYDEWASIAGPEWAWSECLPAFVRLESDQDMPAGPLHGKAGPIPIRRYRPDELVPFQAAFLRACRSLGFPECPDHNDPSTTGFGPHPMNKRDGRIRVSTAMGYLAPARRRPNLAIRPRTEVRRVLVEDGRVLGVEIASGGRDEVVRCRKVVLCAGAFMSPSILVRSGIGPREVLARLGVPLVADLPVGERLLDHPGALLAMVPADGVASFDHPLIQTTLRYTAPGSAVPNDMQLQPLSFLQLGGGMPLMIGIAAVVEKPRGHGRLLFEGPDPGAPPLIRPDLLADGEDRRRMVDGLELALRFTRSPEIAACVQMVVWPAPDVLESAASIDRWVRSGCGSGYHPCGTAPMGKRGDPAAVVDARGRVHGLEGLFVADASIMPTIPRANTNLPSIMIGERFGEWARLRQL